MKITEKFFDLCEKALFAKYATLKLSAGFVVAAAIAAVVMILFL
jgi:hypothetical protein